MDKASLQILLNEGKGVAEIGARFEKSTATVRHWLRKHGPRSRAGEPLYRSRGY